jgi:hypothetical protein
MSSTTTTQKTHPLPGDKALQYAAKLSIEKDKPIMLDYHVASHEGTVCIGKLSESDNIIFRSKDEYTSPIVNIAKSGSDYVCETENSVYLISANTKIKKLSAK